MNNQKTKKMLATIIIVIAIAQLALAAPVFDSVTFIDPVDVDQTQTIQAQISSNQTLSSVLLQIYNQNFTISVSGGVYEYSFSPQNVGTTPFFIYAISNQTTVYTDSFTAINQSSPTITINSPTGTLTTESTTLEITTNEVCSCKYSTTQETYNDMINLFENTDSTTHNQLLTHLSDGNQVYFIACKNNNNKVAYNNATFEVDLPPFAYIDLSENSPLSADTYKVTLTTTKPLLTTPSLKYKYDDETSQKEISLVGQDSRWTGYLVIAESNLDKIGKFYFSGTDYDSLTGTKITGGERFIVDTTKPAAPISIDINLDDDEVELTWFYEGEEADYFNIYKSVSLGVEYVDYYEDTNDNEEFTDIDIDEDIKYYYRVAAVDKAGNVGELSSEVSITYIDEDDDEETETASLDKDLEIELNKTYSDVKTLKFDADFAISQLQKETDRFKSILISELKIIINANTANNNIDNLLKEIDSLRSQDLSTSEFNRKLSNIETKFETIKENIVTDIEVYDTLELTQSVAEQDLSSAIKQVFETKDFDAETQENYTKKARTLQDSSNVFVTIITAKLESINGDGNYFTLVSKEVTMSNDAFDVIIYEDIPKTFAQSTKDITFARNPKVLNEDPVVYFESARLSDDKITYFVNSKKQLIDVKDAKTLILPDPNKFGPKIGVTNPDAENNGITGNAVNLEKLVLSTKEYLFISLGGLLISGLLVYYFFFLKKDDEEEYYLEEEQEFKTQHTLQIFDEEKNNELETVQKAVENVEKNLHSSNYNELAKLYAGVYGLFSSANFEDIEQKRDVAKRITTLYNSIMLKKELESAQKPKKRERKT